MSAQYKKLFRSNQERMIGGVCSGLGEYFSIDPTLIRLLFVFFTLTGGPGLLVYLVLLIVVPEESVQVSPDAAIEPDLQTT